MKLCLDYGFKLNGDEVIIIDSKNGNIVEAGNLIQMSTDKLAHYFPKRKINQLEFNSERDKVVLDSQDLGIHELPGPGIQKVFYGHVCPYAPRFVPLEEGYARRRFYENITENIRGHGYILLDINSPYPSLDTEELGRRRVEFVKDFVNEERLKTYAIRDSLENICKKINGEFERKNE